MKNGLAEDTLLNVNFPAKSDTPIQGMKICRQAYAKWQEEFAEREDPHGKPYYWLTGKFMNYDKGTDTDEWALANHYVSVVPVQFDVTAHSSLVSVNKLLLNE